MSSFNKLQDKFKAETGIAVPVVVGALMITLIFTTIAAGVASSSQHRSARAKQVSRAQAAADAGLNTAVFRLNQVQPAPGECAVKPTPTSPVKAVAHDGSWCPVQSELLEGGAEYRYTVQSMPSGEIGGCQDAVQRRVVSAGYDRRNGVTRTVSASYSLGGGTGLFSKCGVLARKSVRVLGHAKVLSDVGSDGSIRVANSSPPSSQICGATFVKSGGTIQTELEDHICYTRNTDAKPLNLQPYAFPNDPVNYPDQTTITPADPANPSHSGPGLSRRVACPNDSFKYSWNPTTRDLRLSGDSNGCPAQLELHGDNYRFCRITLDGGAKLVIPERPEGRRPLKIWLMDPDSPTCKAIGNYDAALDVTANAQIVNQNSDPTTLVVLGEALSRTVQREMRFISSTATAQSPVPMVIWAPHWGVQLDGDASILGGIAADDVYASTWARIEWSENVAKLGQDLLGLPSHHVRDQESWTQCAPVANWEAPTTGC